MSNALFDVISVGIETGRIRVINPNLTAENAEAVEMMVVMRRGVDSEYFTTVPAGTWKTGDVMPKAPQT